MTDKLDTVTVYAAEDGWRWRRKAPNGEIVSDSGEAYVSQSNARRAARAVNGSGVNYVFVKAKAVKKALKKASKVVGESGPEVVDIPAGQVVKLSEVGK